MGQPQGLGEAPVIQGLFSPYRGQVWVLLAAGGGEGWSARTSRVGTRGDALFLLGSAG